MVFVLDDFVTSPELSSLDVCRKAVTNNYGILVAPSLRKAELRAAVINGLCALGIVSMLSVDNVVETGTVTSAGEGPSYMLSVAGSSAFTDAEAAGPAGGDTTPQVQLGRWEDKPPLLLHHFDPASTQSSVGSRLDARLRWRLARLKMEHE